MTTIEHLWAAFMDHIETGRLDAARASIPELVAAHPSHHLSRCADGVYKMAIGDLVEAFTSFESVTRANPRNLDAWIYLALSAREGGTRGSLEKCRDILLDVIKAFPEIVSGHRHSAFVLEVAAECCDEAGPPSEASRLWQALAGHSGNPAHLERARQASAKAEGIADDTNLQSVEVPRIVCFAPYVTWAIHGMREVTMLHALRLRGAATSVILCDGVFSDCEKHKSNTGHFTPRPGDTCLMCQAASATRLLQWGTQFRWLGRWLQEEDFDLASRWIATLAPQAYERASYNGWDLGEWVKSSVHTHLRTNFLDMSNSDISQTFSSYLQSALLAALALSRMYDRERPTAQILFNGRMSILRVALELAKRRGIRTICEERATVASRVMLFDNTHCLDAQPFIELWRRWRHLPLTEREIDELSVVLRQRRGGTSGDVIISPPASDISRLIGELRLDPSRPIWLLLTSSMDECMAHPGWGGAFPSQEAWIEATITYAALHPDLQLIIRVHPNSGRTFQAHGNAEEIAYFEALSEALPSNVRLVGPTSNLSTYTLAEVAQVGLIWHSTSGMEMAALGRVIVRAGTGLYDDESFTVFAQSPPAYSALLDRVAANTTASPEALVAAWRWAYVFYMRQSFPFPLVEASSWDTARLAYTSYEELAAGKDASLDHICDAVLKGTSLYSDPETRGESLVAAEYPAILARLAEFRS